MHLHMHFIVCMYVRTRITDVIPVVIALHAFFDEKFHWPAARSPFANGGSKQVQLGHASAVCTAMQRGFTFIAMVTRPTT